MCLRASSEAIAKSDALEDDTFKALVQGSSASTNYLATATTALTASESVNALLIVGDGITLSGAAGTALTVGAGGLASSPRRTRSSRRPSSRRLPRP